VVKRTYFAALIMGRIAGSPTITTVLVISMTEPLGIRYVTLRPRVMYVHLVG
jgi:hypothetical protein